MSPRTGRPPKRGISRTGHGLNLRLTEDELKAIESLAEYFNLSRTDAIIASIQYLQNEIEQNTDNIESYMEREYENFCETTTEHLQVAYEDNILEELEQFEEEQWEYFESETLIEMEEYAEENEMDFDREAAIKYFETNTLPELLEKEKKEIECRYEGIIKNEVEEEWENEEKYNIRQYYFDIDI